MPYFSLRSSSTKLNFRGSVSSTSQLPASGNTTNDFYIVTAGSGSAFADDKNPFVSRWDGAKWSTEGPFRTTANSSTLTAVSSSKTLPTARASSVANSWPIWIKRGRVFASGYDNASNISLTVQLPGQSLFTASAVSRPGVAIGTTEPRARVTDFINLDAKYSAASQASGATFGWSASSRYYYGRTSGTTPSLGNIWGLYEYIEVPTAPTLASDGLSVSGSTITATWTAPTDWGGDSSVRKYIVQISSTNTFSSIHETKDLASTSTSTSFENLENGTWYVRVFAYNSIRANFSGSPMSVRSAFRAATVNVINTYTVSFDGTDQKVTIGESITFGAPISGITGKTFVGWYTAQTDGTLVGTAGTVYKPTADIDLYSRYVDNSFTINYNANGGTGTTTATKWTYPSNSGFVAFNAFSRTGFTFVGWGTSASSTTTSYQPGDQYVGSTETSSGSVTLFAIWTETMPVFSDVSITQTGILGRNISLNPDRRVSATPVQSYSILYSGGGQNPTSWLSINSSGDLSGIPDKIGLYTFIVRANNGVGKDQDSPLLSITISPAGKRFTPSPVQLSTAKRFQAGSGFLDLTIMRRFIGIGQPGADANGWISISS